ncbi:hypothetical protein SAMN05421813_105122 [Daejeonella rubra]|uniref:FAD dependent oxidoreductase n=1 Tax=Daejeonella rubra TaxID=990371 RepID=A0A1G9Q5F2_9SPHI|nr:hypothetical protein [Daejeonella rubra]SDM05971.1 hypothetical protein SAMN05421813_105122 [Daejeonella rubra]
MTRRLSILFILMGTCISLQAQTTKTGVLVIGNTPTAVAASIQSARSGAKTMYLTQSLSLNAIFSEEDLPFIKNIRNHYSLKERRRSKATDSIIALPVILKQASNLIKSISDSVKNLTINNNNAVDDIKKDGKGWEIRLKGGQKIKADVVVDATENLSIASMLKIDVKKTMVITGNSTNPFENKLYRSSVALGYLEDSSPFTIPMGSLIPQAVENFIIIPKQTGKIKLSKMSAGQAAGTIASYCAFFNTSTKNINVRVVQGELLAFDAILIPYSDIELKDPNFLTFQRLGLSGLIKSGLTNGKIHFDTAGFVKAEDLRSSMREFYTRSQLWFADNKKDTLTIDDAISLFKFIANRGNELNKEIEEGWKVSFKLNSVYDPKRNISRKEFGILADKYLQPYNIRVDISGNLLR